MTLETVPSRTVNEGDYFVYACTLKDEDGTALPLASIDSLTLDLFHESDDGVVTVINSRTAQDVKNANGGTVHATTGAFSLPLYAADNPIVGTPATGELQKHTLRLTLTYSTTKTRVHEEAIYVTQLASVS